MCPYNSIQSLMYTLCMWTFHTHHSIRGVSGVGCVRAQQLALQVLAKTHFHVFAFEILQHLIHIFIFKSLALNFHVHVHVHVLVHMYMYIGELVTLCRDDVDTLIA